MANGKITALLPFSTIVFNARWENDATVYTATTMGANYNAMRSLIYNVWANAWRTFNK